MKNLWHKILVSIIGTRFVPVETIMSFGGICLGLWLFFTSFDLLPNPFEQVAAAWLALIGGFHLYGLSQDDTPIRLFIRRWASFFESLNFFYVAALLALTVGFSSFGWFAYLMLSLSAATAYLSLSLRGSQVGAWDEM